MNSRDMLFCTYNRMIECSSYECCYRCGWNPDVEAERKRMIRENKMEVNKSGKLMLKVK